MGFPDDSDGKESACNARDLALIPGLERSPGEANVYPLQYSCLENSMDRGAWWATVHGVAKSWTRLSNTFTFKGYWWMARLRGAEGRVQKNPKHTCICPCEVRVSYLPSVWMCSPSWKFSKPCIFGIFMETSSSRHVVSHSVTQSLSCV